MSARRVLQVLDKLHPSSGISAVVMNYQKHMDSTRYQFDFMLNEMPTPDFYEQVSNKGGKFYIMPGLKACNAAAYIIDLKRFFFTHSEYKIVHGHIANAAVFYLGMAKHYRIPNRILHSHNTSPSDVLWKQFRNKLLTIPVSFVCNNQMACSESAARFLFGKHALSKVKILPNAIDLERYRFQESIRQEVRQELELGDSFVIGHVGRFVPQKNHDFILKMFKEVSKRSYEYVLLLVGDGDGRMKVEAQAKSMGIADRIRFLGIRKDVDRIMQAMDLFILPSLFEGLPVVGVEAQAAGLPCMFSNTITAEVQITKQVEFLPLNESALWIENILSARKVADRTQQTILFSDFDIQQQVMVLRDYYDILYKDYSS